MRFCVCVSLSVVSHPLQPYGQQPSRLLCPWNSPSKNTEMGCHSLLQGIFPSQGSNPCFLLCRQILYHLSHQESDQCPYKKDSRELPHPFCLVRHIGKRAFCELESALLESACILNSPAPRTITNTRLQFIRYPVYNIFLQQAEKTVRLKRLTKDFPRKECSLYQ